MIKILKTILFLAICMNVISCQEDSEPTKDTTVEKVIQDDPHLDTNQVNKASFLGTYKGILPCADCSGIETMITLRGDSSYVIVSKFLDSELSPMPFEDGGTFTIGNDRLILTDKGGETWNYAVEKGSLLQIDKQGNPLVNTNVDSYRLNKINL